MVGEVIGKHSKIALQLSGGKDSLVCLHLLRDYLDQITVYFLNSGDAFPETLEIINSVKGKIPNFVEVAGRVKEVREFFGIPSDLAPSNANRFAMKLTSSESEVMVTDRYTCCSESIMYPMHKRMVDDGITLIIRGQKNADKHRASTQSGDIIDGFELLYPIESWTDEDVMSYLTTHGMEIPRMYTKFNSSGDCLGCTAWTEDGRGEYLKEYHPESYEQYKNSLSLIYNEVSKSLKHIKHELGQ